MNVEPVDVKTQNNQNNSHPPPRKPNFSDLFSLSSESFCPEIVESDLDDLPPPFDSDVLSTASLEPTAPRRRPSEMVRRHQFINSSCTSCLPPRRRRFSLRPIRPDCRLWRSERVDLGTLTGKTLVDSMKASSMYSLPHTVRSDPVPKFFFLAINPTSGGLQASRFLQMRNNIFYFEDVVPVVVVIFDISQNPEEGREKDGFRLLREVTREVGTLKSTDQQKNEFSSYLMVAGGDGTVLWAICEMQKYKIDVDAVVLGHVPFGNDFARSLGIHSIYSFDEEPHKMIRRLTLQWLVSVIAPHDLWTVDVSVDPSRGKFLKVDSTTRKKRVLLQSDSEGNNIIQRTMSTVMCNYFSIGVESRIGIGFDRYRTQSAMLNRMRYATEGVKKTFFTPSALVEDMVSHMTCGPPDSCYTVFACQRNPLALVVEPLDPDVPKIPEPPPVDQKGVPVLRRAASLIAVNISSFAAGIDCWSSSFGRSAIGLPPAVGTSEDIWRKNHQNEIMTSAIQKFGDGSLEWVTYTSLVTMAAERALPGRGRRVDQGSGPFELFFWTDIPIAMRVYFQIDGEFFIMTCPEKVVVRFSKKIFVTSGRQVSGHFLPVDVVPPTWPFDWEQINKLTSHHSLA